ncbi:MAG: GIY-YIG nuclease family protein [Candidatus Shapirobacteria bacterium]|jgi:excinuclease ABC subunit C
MILLKNLPDKPGIYIYRDVNNKIIYVGKAINLKKRVTQYFQRDDALGIKTSALVSQIHSISFKTVESEIEALILESSYIKKYKPKYNSLLTDDRSYIYICITKDEYPKVYSAHKSSLPTNAYIYGPFPDGSAVRSILKTIRRLFPYYGNKNHPKTRCLYCHLHLCPGPNPNKIHYLQNIKNIKKILNGKFKSVGRQLKKDMLLASQNEDYEIAIETRNQLEALTYITTGWHNLSNLFESTNLPEDQTSSAINGLKIVLEPYFPKLRNLNRIECFDISQMGTNHFVGAMAVFEDGKQRFDQYRKFKIYSKVTPDDQFMMKEIVFRRLKHPEWGTPDLIVVDGGKPQVSSCLTLTDTPLFGIAKKLETITIKTPQSWIEINLPKNSNSLKLLQNLRNEAHRFANRYRKELMQKSII